VFKRLAAEALGMSDIGVIVPPSEFDKVDADDYLFHEDGERIFFLIKSKKDEYCFTNLALIHVDGDSAVSSKRMVKRYEYANQRVGWCAIETAGNLDMDVELKLGNLAGEQAVVAHYAAVLDGVNSAMLDRHTTRDFTGVFERYIHNDAPPRPA